MQIVVQICHVIIANAKIPAKVIIIIIFVGQTLYAASKIMLLNGELIDLFFYYVNAILQFAMILYDFGPHADFLL